MAVQKERLSDFFDKDGRVIDSPRIGAKIEGWLGDESSGHPIDEKPIIRPNIRQIPLEELPRT